MKKFLLLTFLTFAPLFATNAASFTINDCEIYDTFRQELNKENGNPIAPQKGEVSEIIIEILNVKREWDTWVNFAATGQSFLDPWRKAQIACETINTDNTLTDKQQSNLLQSAKLNFQLAISEYREAESRARMPFIRHGNVLPGPKAGENGSDYVEKKFIPKFVNGTLVFLMSLSVLMVIIGGLMFIFSAGDSDSTSRAKTTIMWSIVGVVITLLAYTIVQFIIGIDFTL